MKLSATVFRLSGLGFSGLVLFSRRVRVSGSFTRDRKQKQVIIAEFKLQFTATLKSAFMFSKS